MNPPAPPRPTPPRHAPPRLATPRLAPPRPATPRLAAHRIACAVVAAEIRRIREADLPHPVHNGWPEATPIGDTGLGLDSLEQLGATGALAETFHLDDRLLGPRPASTVADWIDAAMRSQASNNAQLTVTTSGSTGHPRACTHRTADLLAEAAFLATHLPHRRRVVALVPAHHLYGIVWTALLPGLLGIPVAARTLGAPLGLRPGDLLVAVPDQWQALGRTTRRFPGNVVGVSSAGPLPDSVATGLLAAGLTRLIDVYGASETGAIALRDVPATTYDLLPRWRLVANGAADWQLINSQGNTAALPDHIERTGERSLRPTARRDNAVQVAGHNVSPDRVAQFLRAIDGVADASVRLHANGRLKAFIVPQPGRDPATLPPLIEQAVATLTGAERPKSFRFGPTLPRNAMGKLGDWS